MSARPWDVGQIPTNLMRLQGRVKPEVAVGLALAAEFVGPPAASLPPPAA